MNTVELTTAVAGVATAAGVIFAAFQFRESREQRRAEFELRFSNMYDEVVAKIPLPILLGENQYDPWVPDVRRAFYDYFELCEQECYYFEQGRISGDTWKDWSAGIRSNHAKASFRDAWAELSDKAPDQFLTVRRLFPEWDGTQAH